jgi:hypothetical protein
MNSIHFGASRANARRTPRCVAERRLPLLDQLGQNVRRRITTAISFCRRSTIGFGVPAGA